MTLLVLNNDGLGHLRGQFDEFSDRIGDFQTFIIRPKRHSWSSEMTLLVLNNDE